MKQVLYDLGHLTLRNHCPKSFLGLLCFSSDTPILTLLQQFPASCLSPSLLGFIIDVLTLNSFLFHFCPLGFFTITIIIIVNNSVTLLQYIQVPPTLSSDVRVGGEIIKYLTTNHLVNL